MDHKTQDRNESIRLLAKCYTLEEVARHYGISKQRVSQIVAGKQRAQSCEMKRKREAKLQALQDAYQRTGTIRKAAKECGVSQTTAYGMVKPVKSEPKHNAYRYQRGCRCDTCREANRLKQKNQREKKNALLTLR